LIGLQIEENQYRTLKNGRNEKLPTGFGINAKLAMRSVTPKTSEQIKWFAWNAGIT
jgi:hypothetical protein